MCKCELRFLKILLKPAETLIISCILKVTIQPEMKILSSLLTYARTFMQTSAQGRNEFTVDF